MKYKSHVHGISFINLSESDEVSLRAVPKTSKAINNTFRPKDYPVLPDSRMYIFPYT